MRTSLYTDEACDNTLLPRRLWSFSQVHFDAVILTPAGGVPVIDVSEDDWSAFDKHFADVGKSIDDVVD